MPSLPSQATVRIEIPLGSLVKRRADGSIDFLSPVPCPFNYGSVVDSLAADGDPVDALILGPVLPRGRTAPFAVWGAVDFVDAGLDDPKWVCGARPPTESQWRRIERFFQLYTLAKRPLNRLRGQTGFTGVRGLVRR